MLKITSTNIQFTEEEANQLITLVDVALRSEGLKWAKLGYFFLEKLTTPFTQKTSLESIEGGGNKANEKA